MKEVQRFELPANLALPKVANLTWSESAATDFYDGASTLASIAPSAHNASLALPAIMDVSMPAIQDTGTCTWLRRSSTTALWVTSRGNRMP